MQKIIEFADKVALNENADIPEINKITDDNINEIKSVVNGSLQGTNAMGSIVVDDINCKNLFPGFSNGTYDSSTGAYNPSGNGISTAKIPVISGQTYFLKGIEPATIRVLYWNNGTYVTSEVINVSSAGNTITPQGNYMAIQTDASATYSNVQLEVGSEATAYTEHKNFDGEVYSESEIKIGKWIDGKDLYRKVFTITSLTSSNTNLVDVSGLSIDFAKISGTIITSTGAKFPINLYDSASNYSVIILSDAGYIRGRGAIGSGTLSKCIVILEYTKTTSGTRSITPTEEETR